MRRRTTSLFLLLSLPLGLAACGGGGAATPAAPPPMASVQGMVVKDAVAGCDLHVCEVDPDTGAFGSTTLGGGRSESNGDFAFDFRATPQGLYAVSGRNGSFRNRATDQIDGLGGFDLRGVFCVDTGARTTANVTVMSTMVAFRFQQLRILRPHMPAKLALRLAKAEMSHAFGIGNVDLCPDPAGNADEIKLWLIDIGLVEMARTLGVPAAELVRMFCLDVMDGRPDGFVCGERGTFEDATPWTLTPIDLLKGSMTLWLGSVLNDTGITSSDAIFLSLCVSIDALRGRGILGTLPRILSFTHRFVPLGGLRVGCHLAPYADPAAIQFDTLDFDGDSVAVHVPSSFSTDANGVHTIPFDTPPASAGVRYILAVDRVSGLFDAEAMRFEDPQVTQLGGILPFRGVIVGGGLAKVAGTGFDPDNPPTVRIGGRLAEVESILSPECLRVWVPRGLISGSVDLDVDGVVVPNAYQYLETDLLPTPPNATLRRIMIALSAVDGGALTPPRVIEGVLDFDNRTYDLREHRVDDLTPLGTRLQGILDALDLDPSSEITPATDQVRLDNGLVLEVHPTLDASGALRADIAVARFDPDHPTAPMPAVGMGLVLRGGTSKILRTYDLTGVCIESGLRTQVRGQATFREDGRVFVSGGISKRTDGGRTSFVPLMVAGRFSVDASGNISLSDFPVEAGFTLMKGLIGPGGGTGSVLLKGPGKLVHLLLTARAPALGNVDAFGPDISGVLSRFRAPDHEVRYARTTLDLHEGQSMLLGGLHTHTQDPISGDTTHEERVQARGGYVSYHGRTSSPTGLSTGVLGLVAGLQWDPLPQDGVDAAGELAGSGLGYGLRTGGDKLFSSRSMRADYKVLAMGIELEPDLTPTPNIEHRSIMELGCLVPDTDGVDVDGFSFALASKIRFDRLKRKEVARDASGVVSTTVSGASSETGYALVFAGSEFYAFACPLPAGGTKCFFRGCLTGDGSFGIARSSDGFGAPWHAVLLRKSTTAPRVDGTYNTRFFCHTFDGSSVAYAINGAGTYTFDETSGTYGQDTSQVAISETLATVPSGPDVFPGVFSVTADGCIDMTTDFGGGFTSDLCGAVHENGSVIVTMDPEPAEINCFTIYTLRDETPGSPALTPERAMYCGLHLDFDGAGGIFAATRVGRMSMTGSTLSRTLRTAEWSNIAPSVTVSSETLTSRPLTVMPGRTFTSDLALGRILEGARSSLVPIIGSQAESGVAAPAGAFGVSIRRTK